MPATHLEEDGYLRYDELSRQRAAGSYDFPRLVQSSIAEYTNRFAGFRRLSPARMRYSQALLEYARDRHIRVAVFVTPLHPSVIRALAPVGYPARLTDVVTYLHGQSRSTGAVLYDYSSVDRFGGDPDDFWDGGHMSPANCDRLTRRLLSEYRALQ